MEIDEDEAFLYGDEPAAAPAAPAPGAADGLQTDAATGASPAAGDDDDGDEEEEEEEESDDDLEIILDGDSAAPAPQARRPIPSRPVAASPQKPNIAPAPSATTEYAPLDRPGLAKANSSTSVGPPTLPHPDATATDQASTAALAAQAVEGTPNPDVPMTSTGTPLKASAVPELVPRGALTPFELKPAATPTFDVNAVQKDANGNDLFDVDLDAIEDKPWRRPGANMADYFNYGMNEATWKNYARKQRELRSTESAAANPFAGFATGNIQQAWADLTAEQKQLLMGTIMGFQPGSMPAPAQMAQMAQMGMMAAQMGGMPPGAVAGGMHGHGGMGMSPMAAAAMGMQGMGGMHMNGMTPAQAQAMAARNMAQAQAQQQAQAQAQQQQAQQQAQAGGEDANGLKREESESGVTPGRGGDDATPAPSEAQEDIHSGDIAGFGADAMNPAFGLPMNPLAARGRGGMMGGMRGRGLPAGPGMRGGAMVGAMGRGRGGMAMGAVPTGPRAALPGNIPTGPRAGAAPPTGPRVSAARSYRDKDVDRFGGAGADAGGLDYGGGGGGASAADDYERSPVRSRSRRESPDYGRDSGRRSRHDRSRSRERDRASERERDREYERQREKERERERRRGGDDAGDKKRGMSDFFPDKASRDDRSVSPGLRIRGAGGSRDESPPRRSSSRRDDDGKRSRGGTYSPEGGRRSRRTQWSDDEGDAPDESRKRKAEDDAESERPRRRSTRRD
ncbi:Cleavage polyadenylation factor subunit fip1 [Rhodotorula kratochvilovae]